MNELTSTQRTLLLLLAQDPPLPYQEISRRLGIPIGSIGPTRARYMAKLRETQAVRALFPEQATPNAAHSSIGITKFAPPPNLRQIPGPDDRELKSA